MDTYAFLLSFEAPAIAIDPMLLEHDQCVAPFPASPSPPETTPQESTVSMLDTTSHTIWSPNPTSSSAAPIAIPRLSASTPPPEKDRERQFSGHCNISSANPNEDWTQISDLAERRRIQNRISQRKYRQKFKKRLENLERHAGTSDGASSSSGAEKATTTPNSPSQRQQQQNGVKRGIPVHACKVCNKTFTTADSLRQHQRSPRHANAKGSIDAFILWTKDLQSRATLPPPKSQSTLAGLKRTGR